MNRNKYILWLPSWYPDEEDTFNGDFIKRHAEAASLLTPIYVIYAVAREMDETSREQICVSGNLTEHLIYYKKKEGPLWKIKKQLIWRRLLLGAFRSLVTQRGLPKYIHVHVPWKAGIIALHLKRKFGIPFFVTEHWGIYNQLVEDNYYTFSLSRRLILKRIFTEAKCLLSVSEYIAQQISQVVELPCISIVPNVVDTDIFYYKPKGNDIFTFIHVSNMVPIKNVIGIIDAFCDLLDKKHKKKVQLVLIGNKADYIALVKRTEFINRSIFFLGEVSYSEVAQKVREAHCFILNSIIENSPCVIGEALCCGLPVIATAVGGVPELVGHGDGILIKEGDPKALANGMEEVLTNYQNYDGERIAQKAKERFGYQSVAARFSKFYDSN